MTSIGHRVLLPYRLVDIFSHVRALFVMFTVFRALAVSLALEYVSKERLIVL